MIPSPTIELGTIRIVPLLRCTPYWPGSPWLQRTHGSTTCEVCEWIFRTCSSMPGIVIWTARHIPVVARTIPKALSSFLLPPFLSPEGKKIPRHRVVVEFTTSFPSYKVDENVPVSQVAYDRENGSLLFIHGIYETDGKETTKRQDRAAIPSANYEIVYFGSLGRCSWRGEGNGADTSDVNVPVSQSICAFLCIPGGHGTPWRHTDSSFRNNRCSRNSSRTRNVALSTRQEVQAAGRRSRGPKR